MRNPLYCAAAILLWMAAAWGQIVPARECALAAQSPARRASLPNIFVVNPKPFVFQGTTVRLRMTARIVSVDPLMFEVLDVDPPSEARTSCGKFLPVTAADAKLRPLLSSLRFNQVLRLTFFFADSPRGLPDKVVLESATFDIPPGGACPNRTGIAIGYDGHGGHVNVFNDGTIRYEDPQYNVFAEKLSHDEKAALLKSFADVSFDRIPAGPLPADPPADHRITLACSRGQSVPVAGLEARLTPLLTRLDHLRERATVRDYYVLLSDARHKLTILNWPFRQVTVRQIESLQQVAPQLPDAIHDPVPEDFLARLPEENPADAKADPARFVYVAEGGRLYRVTRRSCSVVPERCRKFEDLTARRVQQTAETARPNGDLTLYGPGGLYWPSDIGIPLAATEGAGRRLSNEEFAAHPPLNSKLFEWSASGMGRAFIDDGYLYEGVRICRIDPTGPPSECLHPKPHP